MNCLTLNVGDVWEILCGHIFTPGEQSIFWDPRILQYKITASCQFVHPYYVELVYRPLSWLLTLLLTLFIWKFLAWDITTCCNFILRILHCLLDTNVQIYRNHITRVTIFHVSSMNSLFRNSDYDVVIFSVFPRHTKHAFLRLVTNLNNDLRTRALQNVQQILERVSLLPFQKKPRFI